MQPGDLITWTAVKQDQPHAHQLMKAQGQLSGCSHSLTAAGSQQVQTAGRWVHEEFAAAADPMDQAERGTGGGVCVCMLDSHK